MQNTHSPFFSKTANTINRYAHKISQQRRKLIAALLICSFGLTLYGTFGVYSAIAATADSTYTVTNTVYFNATVMGSERTFRIDITQDTQSDAIDLPIKAVQGTGFEPNITIDLGTQIGVSQQVESFNTFGWNTNENTTYFMAQRYIDGLSMMNTSMYYANFPHTNYAYPATEKQLLFDSPLHYVEDYCDENSLDLVEILNSTYAENVSYSNLNGLHSELIKTCYGISEPLEEPILAQVVKFGDGLNPEVKLAWYAIVALVTIVCFFATSTILGTVCLITGAQTAQHFADCNLAAVKYQVDAITNWSTTLKATWDEQQAIAWAAYEAGNITLADYQMLCKLYTGQYQPLLMNTTTDFQTALDAYYSAQQYLFDEVENPKAFAYSSNKYCCAL